MSIKPIDRKVMDKAVEEWEKWEAFGHKGTAGRGWQWDAFREAFVAKEKAEARIAELEELREDLERDIRHYESKPY